MLFYFAGIDDAASECDLDMGVTFDVVVDNNDDDQALNAQLTDLVHSVNTRITDWLHRTSENCPVPFIFNASVKKNPASIINF